VGSDVVYGEEELCAVLWSLTELNFRVISIVTYEIRRCSQSIVTQTRTNECLLHRLYGHYLASHICEEFEQ